MIERKGMLPVMHEEKMKGSTQTPQDLTCLIPGSSPARHARNGKVA